jgi:hypothetical protein
MVNLRTDGDGRAGTAEHAEHELEALERSVSPRAPGWAWALVLVGLAAAIGLSVHAFAAYATVDRFNQNAKLVTSNVVLLFQDVATNGARVPPAIESNNRATYTRALTQYVLDGTGVCLGLALAIAGLFVRLNR